MIGGVARVLVSLALALLASAAAVQRATDNTLRAPLSGLTLAGCFLSLVLLGAVGRSVWALALGVMAIIWWPLLEGPVLADPQPAFASSCDPGCIEPLDFIVYLAVLGLSCVAAGWGLRAVIVRSLWRRRRAAEDA